MKDSYPISDYQHMASGHNTATATLPNPATSVAQCAVGRDLIKLGKLLVSTSQNAEGLEAALSEVNRLRSDLLAIAGYTRQCGRAK